ncbi:unnamed protein product, partial [marine sediment metagenome]
MEVKARVEPSEGKVGDSVTLRVQFTRMEGQIKSVYATANHERWQLHKDKEGKYSLNMQIPPFLSPGTYNINIFAENEKKKKIVEVTVPFLVKDEEVEEEPGFSRVNHIIQEMESAKCKTLLKENPLLLEKTENYILSIRVAKRLLSSKTY